MRIRNTEINQYFLFSWYFGKIEAEKKLLLRQNELCAYLIQDSEVRRNDFSLSVRDRDTVKHYWIRQLDKGGFFIARRTTFRSTTAGIRQLDKRGFFIARRTTFRSTTAGTRMGSASTSGRPAYRYSNAVNKGFMHITHNP